MMNAFSEGLVLADKSGISPNTLLDVLVRHVTKNLELALLCRLRLIIADESIDCS